MVVSDGWKRSEVSGNFGALPRTIHMWAFSRSIGTLSQAASAMLEVSGLQ